MAGKATLKNIPIAFEQLIKAGWTAEWDDGDEVLEYADLAGKTFEGVFLNCLVSKQSGFKNLPGSVVLRRCSAGRILCEAGQRGATVFYVLTRKDAVTLGFGNADESISGPSEVGRIFLPGKPQERKRQTWRGRIRNLFQRQRPRVPENVPRYIPNDGSAYLDAQTRSAPLLEGELTGEMTCLTRSPRSATIHVSTDCFLIEVTKSVFEGIHKNDAFTRWAEELYRERILENHLRNDVPLFRSLDDESYEDLKDIAEFVYFQPGQVIYDEHQTPPDSFYVIRQGVVQVVKGTHLLLGAEEFSDDAVIRTCQEIVSAQENALEGAISVFWEMLSEKRRQLISDVAGDAGANPGNKCEAVRAELNSFIRNTKFPCRFVHSYRSLNGLKAEKEPRKVDALNGIGARESDFRRFETDHHSRLEDKVSEWSDVECRLFNRLYLEAVCRNGIPRRSDLEGNTKTLRYLSRGEFFGEMGVIRDAARSATCMAYDHPDMGQKKDTETKAIHRVELVRFDAELLRSLVEKSETFRRKVESVIAERDSINRFAHSEKITNLARRAGDNPALESLGLLQGQRQMLIDLDKCTRCGECVDACVESHDDDRSRLFLDGPRFEKWLVPMTCRTCLDPVCMVNCPVGSILRGSDGEILIQDWCIGCKACADNCPYDSIQMHILDQPRELTETEAEIGGGADLKRIDLFAVVCDNCSSNPVRPGEPACVYSCPHDAALRVDSRQFFLGED